mmetsp:Transcript_2063/g.4678  ORF Transcript_2063/g.4678 Transcript_2063/m.4678 type:complete len:244 (-) Transcript_2063:287-1018(-)|eukprot:CAMPEP_0113631308 /NCGR_PEP_ID=MMETSP0017_2-20120614/16269_1 /TAXON_ID=2856 /ORGANISM="Cylindrotheca closterium" /LENGTH=243 /DNA_ID=CAMNT_0000541811 /DNA_START=156 /DNA_END=887 /DNA_ORIENTATION=- /assembly_acc=CAM_ASM_000147
MVVEDEIVQTILQFVALPVIIGLLVGINTFYYQHLVTRRTQGQSNRMEELRHARETYENIMSDMENLFSLMKYSAWNVAWRKARPAGIFPPELLRDDQENWKLFEAALRAWRRNKIRYKAEVEMYFGKKESAARQLRIIDATMEKYSYELWLIYNGIPNNPNVFLEHYVQPIEESYNSIFNCIMKANRQTITKEQEENVHQVTSSTFDDLEEKIIKLCLEMSESLKKENVGNMRKGRLYRQMR